jgi:hypothetical protein
MQSGVEVERPHHALDMCCPAEIYTPSTHAYRGLPELAYPFQDKTIHVTCCGRICLHRKKTNLSPVFAGQAVGLKEVEERIWLVSFMGYDLGYIDLEEKLCSFSTTLVSGTFCNPCVQVGPSKEWRARGDSNSRPSGS